VTWRARGCAAIAVLVCAGVAGTGRASAADSLGIDALVTQIETEVSSELAAAVPQPAAAGFRAGAHDTATVEQATAEGTSAEALGAGPAVLTADAAAPPVDMSAPGAPPGVVSVSIGPAPSAEWMLAPSHAAGPGVLHVVTRARTRSTQKAVLRTHVSLAVSATARSEATASAARVTIHERVQTASRARASPRPAGAAPPDRNTAPGPPPPPPGPNRPDTSSAGQSGGQGFLLPLVLATLAAALAIFGFALLPRVLPLPAFRKPRRIVLPPWHPG
jgi:hypothetical protein